MRLSGHHILHERSAFPNACYPTDLVLDDVVADTVLVVKDLLIGRSIKHSFDIILINQNTNKQNKMRLSGHHILHERSAFPNVCYPTDLVLDDVVADTVLVVKDLLIGRSIKHSFDIILINQNTNRQCKMRLSGHHILHERSAFPNVCYPTDLVLDDVVADTVLVVKDLLIGRCIKHSFDIILIHQNTNRQCKMRLSGHHILHLRSTLPHVCHYPTDLVLDDVVADTVLVVKDLLIGRCIKHSFDIILIHQNTNKQCKMRLSGHHIWHERSTFPDVCYATDLVLDDVVADTVLVVKDLLMGRCIKHSFDIILIHQNTNKHCKMRLSGHHILHLRSTLPHVCHYPTDLVLDDVVADTVLVVKDLLIGRSIKHSFDIILNHQNTNKQCKMRLSGHHIWHERSTFPHVCYPTDLVLDDVVADTVLVVKDLLMGRSIKHSTDIILIHQNTNKLCKMRLAFKKHTSTCMLSHRPCAR